jgi:hypothetical protein
MRKIGLFLSGAALVTVLGVALIPNSADAATAPITVNDKSSSHNFHLTGPGINRKTVVATTGSVVWNLSFAKGKYNYVCDPHNSSMHGSFTVK